jgi:hypothetical protein
MAALTASDVTVTHLKRAARRLVEGIREVFVDLTFGDGAKTYPTDGIPMPALGALGLSEIIFAHVEDKTNGYKYVFDRSNHKLMILQALGGTPAGTVAVDDHTHDLKLLAGITATEPVACDGAALNFGKNAATDRVIAGANSATKGGVVAKTGLTGAYNGSAGDPGPMAQVPASYAPASMSVRVKLVGN